jgi:hypothetical protein
MPNLIDDHQTWNPLYDIVAVAESVEDFFTGDAPATIEMPSPAMSGWDATADLDHNGARRLRNWERRRRAQGLAGEFRRNPGSVTHAQYYACRERRRELMRVSPAAAAAYRCDAPPSGIDARQLTYQDCLDIQARHDYDTTRLSPGSSLPPRRQCAKPIERGSTGRLRGRRIG